MNEIEIKLSKDDQNQIAQALQYLAGVCDYARELDGQGFNAFDAEFGHSLASQSAIGALSEIQFAYALVMINNYRKQCANVGIVFPELPRTEKKIKARDLSVKISHDKSIETNSKLFVENDIIFATFDGRPSIETRNAIKSINGWRWNPDRSDKAWSVPANVFNAHKLIEIMPDAQTDENIDAFLKQEIGEPAKIADVTIRKVNGVVEVLFPAADGRRERVAQLKSLPERKWMPDLDGKPWHVPSRFIRDLVEMFPGAELDNGAKELLQAQIDLSHLSDKATGGIDVDGLNGDLYPFQKVGVQFADIALNNDNGVVIADEMGLGKTIQAIAYLQHHPELRPALIVVPASLKTNWAREISTWMTTNETISILNGRKANPFELQANIVIINWDILSYWKASILKRDFAIVIADEAHYIKNFQGMKSRQSPQRSKALIEIAHAIKRTILLTGTPVTNRPKELFPLLHAINPEAWPSFWRYAKKYCGAYNNGWGWDFSGATNLEELHERTRAYIVRRKKEQVLKELPAKRRVNIIIDFADSARAEYMALIDEARQAASMTQAEQLVFLEKAKQVAVKAKLPGAIEWIRNFIDTGEKLVVFVTHHSTVDALMNEFGNVAVSLTGRTKQQDRQKAIDAFQNDPNVLLFVGNIKAAGVGITLTAASNVAFIEYAWTPGDMTQAEDRVHRIGQEGSVTIWHMIAENTIDHDLVALLEEKRIVTETVSDGIPSEHKFGLVNELMKRLTVQEIGA